MVNKIANGKTNVYGVIGNPIEHTFSPQIQNTFASKLQKNIVYVPFHVTENGLEKAIKGAYELNIKGLNVTVPHKKEVMKFLCDIDERAKQIGAVNTLKYTENGYVGYNTDFIGVLYALKNKGIEVKDKTVLLLGAGGSACASAVMALSEGCKKLVIANRTKENAEKLKNHVQQFYSNEIVITDMSLNGDFGDCDIAINTTVLGFGKNVGLSPIADKNDFKRLNIKACFDAIYVPWETQFLKDAKDLGIVAINGFDMLVYQAVAAQEIWFDTKYDEDLKEKTKNELETYYKSL